MSSQCFTQNPNKVESGFNQKQFLKKQGHHFEIYHLARQLANLANHLAKWLSGWLSGKLEGLSFMLNTY